MKYNQELRTILSDEAYIADKKGMHAYSMRMTDPDGEGPPPEFATIHTNKGKLYSIRAQQRQCCGTGDQCNSFMQLMNKAIKSSNCYIKSCLKVVRQQDVEQLRLEFDPDILEEEGIIDTEKYRNKQHQFRRNEQDKHRGMEQKDQKVKYLNYIEGLHSFPEIDIDIIFETNKYEISDYIRVHEKYSYHQVETDNNVERDVIMLCDAQNQEQFNRIMNQELSRFDKETTTLRGYRQSPRQRKQKIESTNENAEAQTIKYKYLLPIDANSERRVPLEIRSEQSIGLYKQYLRTVVGTMQERTNTDTHEKIIATFSIMFFIFQYPLGGAAIPSLKQYIKRREIYYVDCKVNLCFWSAYSFITMPNTKDKCWKDCTRIAEAKCIFYRVNGVEFRENYQGFDFVNDIDNFISKEQVNVHLYTFEDNSLHYELTQNYIVDNKEKQFNILFIKDGTNAHIMYISDVEALTGFRYCNICHRQAFRFKDLNLQVSIRNHMKKKQVYGKYGDNSQVIASLVPYAIASTVKSVNGIHSFYFDIRTDDFMDKWFDQLFEEAKQIMKDNKYKDETIPQYFEVSVIEFNSAKFDTSLVLKNLKSNDWTNSKYLRSSIIANQIVVKLKKFGVQLKIR
ncbi:MAG: hypothetical protein EZS28_010292 [Streblomastix strix]|uniref:Uncharacterized protein n=1 Tax=Streblomastix strix TaxID=222440 RepID=A0A5J4WIK4_9EUKA|nr:MAG: hypothetical protein EZS28_010292 [Streblomastix strix]